MIEQAVEELTPLVGTRPACRALGVAPATVYRRRRPPQPRPETQRAPAPSPRALSVVERDAVLGVLRSERFVDSSPAQVWATLLDEGRYLCSERTMYRLLAEHQEVRERRDQLTHPAYARPELLAEGPNQVWSWDITKLLGPAKWTYHYLYVILDVFSRYVVGWTVQPGESATLAEQLIAQATTQQQINRGQLTLRQLHEVEAGRLPARRPRRHQEPLPALYLHRQPLLGGALQDPEVPARLPGAVRIDRGGQELLPAVLRLVQPPAPPLRHRADDPRCRPLRPGRDSPLTSYARPGCRLRGQSRPLRARRALPACASDRRLDQPAKHTRGCSLITAADCLAYLDRLRADCIPGLCVL